MNVFDKNLLFEMSYALMRRFAFVEVTCPSDEAYHELLEGPGDIVRELLPLRRFRDLGPAVYLDAAKFAVRRAEDQPSREPPALRGLLRLLPAAVRGHRRRAGRARCTTRWPSCSTTPSAPRPAAPSARSSAPRSRSEPRCTASSRAAASPSLLDWLARPYDPERVTAALLGLPTARRPGSSSAPCSPPATRPRTCSTPCPRSCGRWPSPPPTGRSAASARSAGRCCGARRCRPARRRPAIPGCSCAPPPPRPTTPTRTACSKAALAAVHRAGRNAEHGMDGYTDDVVKRARHNGQHAGRLLEHQTLAQVPVVRPTGRALRRTRAGSRRHTYRPALALLRRAGEPMRADHLSAFADERTAGPARPAGGHAAAPRGRHRQPPRCSAATTAAWPPARSRTTTPAAAATRTTSTASPSATCCSTSPTRCTATPTRPGRASQARAGGRRAVLAVGAERRRSSRRRSALG